ncbi:MAG: hypothetical protein QXU99_05850 [Candidatus Bathyarchaeia archaeon]
MGTEIRTFTTLKEASEYFADQINQYKVLFEDYSQWLGSLLRSCEETHKNDEWYKKSIELQKNLAAQAKKMPVPKESVKKASNKKHGGKGKNVEAPVWIESGNLSLSSTEQAQAEILFEAIEKISSKIQEIERSKAILQQLERLGLGLNVHYIVYIEDDVPKKLVLRVKASSSADDIFKFATEFSVQALFNNFEG